MGWDAFSSARKNYNLKGLSKIVSPTTKKLFKNADRYVRHKTGTVDAYLIGGGLDCSTCAYMLEKATGLSAWDEKGWDKKR